ncbi:MAG: YlbE-like family protein [Bacilli bacterium]
MNLEVQFKLKSNPNYIRYIRENSFWYKYLNRSPEVFPLFISEMKERYKLRSTDKLNSFISNIAFIQDIINVMK